MNDLDDRLTDLLGRAAAAVPVRPDIDAVLDDDVVVDLDGRRRPRRAAFALVAAAVLVLGALAAVALAATGEPTAKGVTDAPPAPTERFPVLGALPPDLTGTVVARGGPLGDVTLQYLSMFGEDVPVVRAVIGRVAEDGTVADAAVLQVVPGELTPDHLPGSSAGTVTGRPARVLTDGATDTTQILVTGDGASLVATGPSGFLDELEAFDGLVITVLDGRPVLRLGTPGPGVEVLLPPGPVEEGPAVEVGAGRPGEPEVLVTAGHDDPLAIIAGVSDTFAPVDVGGARGWLAEPDDGAPFVSWRGPGGVALLVQGRLSPEDALLVARGVRLVDEETWVATYGDDPDGIPIDEATTASTVDVDPTDHPLVGRTGLSIDGRGVGPDLPSSSDDPPGSDRRPWSVVSFTGTWCEPCRPMFAELAGVAEELGDDVRVTSVFVDDTNEAADALARAEGVSWLALVGDDDSLGTWGVMVGDYTAPLPLTAIGDPDGTIRAVYERPLTAAEIVDAIEELGG